MNVQVLLVGIAGKIVRFVMGVVLFLTVISVFEIGVTFVRTKTDAYQASTQFAMTNLDVLQVTGPVSEVSLDNNFNSQFCNRQADYSLRITGAKGTVILYVQLKYKDNSWVVTEAALNTASRKAIPIHQTSTWDPHFLGLGFPWPSACWGIGVSMV